MAFPRTPVLDDFNTGANQVLSTRPGWSAVASALTTNATPDRAVKVTPGNYSTAYRDGRVTNGEAWLTIKTISVSSWYLFGGHFYAHFTGSTLNMREFVLGVDTLIGTNSIPGGALATGDSIGISFVGLSLIVYLRRSGGEWAEIGLATGSDATAVTPQQIGWEMAATNNGEVDEFGGGAILERPTASWTIKASG